MTTNYQTSTIHEVLTLEVCKLQKTNQAVISCITEEQRVLQEDGTTTDYIMMGVGALSVLFAALMFMVWLSNKLFD